MATTSFNRAITTPFNGENVKTSLFTRFLNWAEAQQENRLLWLGIAVAGHGCVFTPITIFAVVLSGTSLFLFMLAIAAMGMALVTNLAAMPTKYTIPVLFLSLLIDLVIIISSVFIGLNLANTNI